MKDPEGFMQYVDKEMHERVPKRYIRDMQDPFQFYVEQKFVQISISERNRYRCINTFCFK
ncbi:hypothetical protein D910_08169 [Dendroctonus ponderosae]